MSAPQVVISAGLKAAREGRNIRRWLVDVTITADFVVQTVPTIYYNIPEGKQIVIARMHVGCETVEEYIIGYVVACNAVNGGGDVTELHAPAHDHVGSKKEGSGHIIRTHNPPIVVSYLDGFRSVSMAVKATDEATVVAYGWNGWIESYRRLSN